eukprot:Skav229055  [mRNA]  locus=scaffold7847:9107:11099:+ [translate_table: standard]
MDGEGLVGVCVNPLGGGSGKLGCKQPRSAFGFQQSMGYAAQGAAQGVAQAPFGGAARPMVMTEAQLLEKMSH